MAKHPGRLHLPPTHHMLYALRLHGQAPRKTPSPTNTPYAVCIVLAWPSTQEDSISTNTPYAVCIVLAWPSTQEDSISHQHTICCMHCACMAKHPGRLHLPTTHHMLYALCLHGQAPRKTPSPTNTPYAVCIVLAWPSTQEDSISHQHTICCMHCACMAKHPGRLHLPPTHHMLYALCLHGQAPRKTPSPTNTPYAVCIVLAWPSTQEDSTSHQHTICCMQCACHMWKEWYRLRIHAACDLFLHAS